MLRILSWAVATSLAVVTVVAVYGADAPPTPTYDLTAELKPGDAADVTATLEVGGDLVTPAENGKGDAKLPLSIVAKQTYQEQLLAWSADVAEPCRSVRRYSSASANTKTESQSDEQSLAENRRVIVAEISDLGVALGGIDGPLSRNEFILLDAVGNTLALDRLLPGKSLAEGEGWDHDPTVMGMLLGMDHVAVCEVRSVVTGEDNGQVQIRMAGTVQGTVNGASAEMELRAAYLYHLDRHRITKFNLAIKERLKAGDVAPGLDVTAKLSIVAAPIPANGTPAFDKATLKTAEAKTRAELRELAFDAADRGYRFRQDMSWFVVHEARELTSFKLVDEGELLARCSVATAPPRPADKPMTLQEFERDVVKALGEKVGKVTAANEWTTPTGCKCLGIFVDGQVSAGDGLESSVEVQWRYYHLSQPGMPQATIAVTVEQMLVERFANADRPLVDSMELVAAPGLTTTTASKPTTKK